MSISMGLMGASGHFMQYDPYPTHVNRIRIYHLQCRRCGYESIDAVVGPRICSKCGGGAWERFMTPGTILHNAERYAE
jgi:ribosomal protein L37E